MNGEPTTPSPANGGSPSHLPSLTQARPRNPAQLARAALIGAETGTARSPTFFFFDSAYITRMSNVKSLAIYVSKLKAKCDRPTGVHWGALPGTGRAEGGPGHVNHQSCMRYPLPPPLSISFRRKGALWAALLPCRCRCCHRCCHR